MKQISYKTVKSDYNYLVSNYGSQHDFCGGVCNTEMYDKLLDSPTEETAKKQMITIIEAMFFHGVEGGIGGKVDLVIREDDKRGKRIKERYGIL